MSDTSDSRSARLAAQFEAAHGAFTRLVESLTEEQWRQIGRNHPKRINDEDEGRPVGIIAHHAATSSDTIMNRIQLALQGQALPPIDFAAANARHAAEHPHVTAEDVLGVFRESGPRLAAAVRAIPDAKLDDSVETAAGPMTIAMRLEMVLIGHLRQHQGSIEATIAEP
jgi:DinB family protein